MAASFVILESSVGSNELSVSRLVTSDVTEPRVPSIASMAAELAPGAGACGSAKVCSKNGTISSSCHNELSMANREMDKDSGRILMIALENVSQSC